MYKKIIPVIIDKFDPLREMYKLVIADYQNDYCKGINSKFPNLIFTFKLHNVDIKLVRFDMPQ